MEDTLLLNLVICCEDMCLNLPAFLKVKQLENKPGDTELKNVRPLSEKYEFWKKKKERKSATASGETRIKLHFYKNASIT